MNNNLLFYGGTFNPIHNGHIIIAQSALEEIGDINKIILIPNNNPPHKEKNISAHHKVNMCKIVSKNNTLFDVEEYESKNEKTSYTINTLCYLKNKYNIKDKINFLIGEDSLLLLKTWYKFEEILKLCRMCVMRVNSGFCTYDVLDGYKKEIIYIHSPVVNIRATEIRDRIKNNKNVYGMLPDGIIKYINDNNLYRD